MTVLKTDPVALTSSEKLELSKNMNSFMDRMRTTATLFAVAFVIIVFFITGPFRPQSSIYLLLIRFAAAALLAYAVYTNVQTITGLYGIKGIFSFNSMHDIRVNFYLCIVFTILMLVLAGLLIYKHGNGGSN
jgi:hypothetical protein